jgi:hypothetical protein
MVDTPPTVTEHISPKEDSTSHSHLLACIPARDQENSPWEIRSLHNAEKEADGNQAMVTLDCGSASGNYTPDSQPERLRNISILEGGYTVVQLTR